MKQILFALFVTSPSAQFIEARSNKGTVDISVNVEGSVIFFRVYRIQHVRNGIILIGLSSDSESVCHFSPCLVIG